MRRRARWPSSAAPAAVLAAAVLWTACFDLEAPVDPAALSSMLAETAVQAAYPLPALVSVELPAPALEAEGFAGAGQSWEVPGLGLWASLQLLEGRWLAPDPVMAWVAHERSAPDTPFDVRAFAARERSARAPDEREIHAALEEGLRAADVYRLSWRVE